MDRTFILTAELDRASFDWLDGLRRAHFPQERNLLPAHLTLFHRLSPAQTRGLADVALPAAPMPLRCAGFRLLGFGVAIEIICPELDDCGQRCRSPWAVSCPGRTARAGGRTSPSRTRSRPLQRAVFTTSFAPASCRAQAPLRGCWSGSI